MIPSELPLVFCFAGQGSQYHQMAAELHASNPTFRHWMARGDEAVRARHGFSVIEAIYGAGRRPSEPFDRLEATNPAVFLVQYALARTVMEAGVTPDALLGVSLGEVVGMSLAGMLSFEEALQLVCDQPAVYRRSCLPGGMTAVLGAPELQRELDPAGCALAGVSGRRHFLIAGPEAGLAAAEAELLRRDLPFQRLPVPFAFHSPWIEPAAAGFRALLPETLRTPRWPCWSCCLATPAGPEVEDLFWRIVREPIRLEDTVRALEARGGAVYLDLSPSGTLATVLRMSLGAGAGERALQVLSPFAGAGSGLERALEALAARRAG